jgi:hypothetical protein
MKQKKIKEIIGKNFVRNGTKMEMQDKIREIVGFLALSFFAIIGRYLLVANHLQPFPNFEIVTVAAFLAVMLVDIRIAILIPLLGMVGSDLLIGNPIFIGEKMNQIVMFTYSGFALAALIIIFGKSKLKPIFSKINAKSALFAGGMGASLVLIYDLWTNFGWWYLLYPHNIHSLLIVYSLGLPFMLYHLISGVTTFVFIGLPISALAISKLEISIPKKISHKIPAAIIGIILVIISFTGCIGSVEGRATATVEFKSMEFDEKVNVTLDEGSTALDFVREAVNKLEKPYKLRDDPFGKVLQEFNRSAEGKFTDWDGKMRYHQWQVWINENPKGKYLTTTVKDGDNILLSYETFGIVNASVIIVKEGNTLYSTNVTLKEGSNAFDAIWNASQLEGYSVSFKVYPGLGVYIDSITGIDEGGGKYWFFYYKHPGEEYTLSPVGVSSYTIKSDDCIKMSFESWG